MTWLAGCSVHGNVITVYLTEPGHMTSDSHRFGVLAGQGFGLPMSRAYAEYFGGHLHGEAKVTCFADIRLFLQFNQCMDMDVTSS